jgi:hypothetical protein
MALSKITSQSIQDETIIPTDILDYSITSNQLSNTGVTATTFGGGTSGTVVVPVIVTDIAGRITSAANQSLSLTSFGTVDVTALASSGKVNVFSLQSNTSIFTSNLTVTGTTSIAQAKEKVTVTGTGAGGAINYDALTQAVVYYNSSSTSNFTVNVRGNSATSLNSVMNVGESLTIVLLSTQGASSFYLSGITIDGTATGVTTRWATQTPTAGGTTDIDAYTLTIIKTASATFTVLAAQTKFVP